MRYAGAGLPSSLGHTFDVSILWAPGILVARASWSG
jgi:hypothetical protein